MPRQKKCHLAEVIRLLKIGYIRLSTDQQLDGNGVDLQKKAVIAAAAVNGDEIDLWLIDVVTGVSDRREKLDELRERVRQGEVERVYVYDLGRLARDVVVGETARREFMRHGCEVVSATEHIGKGPMGDLMAAIMFAFKQYERAAIKERLAGGRWSAVRKKGGFGGGHGFLGFRSAGKRREYDAEGNIVRERVQGHGLLIPVEEELLTVRLIFRLRAEGFSHQRIADHLNERGIRGVRGGKWHRSTIQRIIEREPFYRAQAVIHRNAVPDPVAIAHEPVLEGLPEGEPLIRDRAAVVKGAAIGPNEELLPAPSFRVPPEEKAKFRRLVEEVFRRDDGGRPVNRIVTELNAEGFASPYGHPLHHRHVYRIREYREPLRHWLETGDEAGLFQSCRSRSHQTHLKSLLGVPFGPEEDAAVSRAVELYQPDESEGPSLEAVAAALDEEHPHPLGTKYNPVTVRRMIRGEGRYRQATYHQARPVKRAA